MTEETIFLTALEKKNPAERTAYLDAVCVGDPALRERVEALLRSHADPDSFLDTPAIARQGQGKAEPTLTLQRPDNPEPLASADESFAFLTPSSKAGALGQLDHYEVLERGKPSGSARTFASRVTLCSIPKWMSTWSSRTIQGAITKSSVTATWTCF